MSKKPEKKKKKRTQLKDAPDAPPIITKRNLQIYLTEEEWTLLLTEARESKKALRNETLILVMYELGLRRAEPGVLRLSYANKLDERLLYAWRGKGSKSGYSEISEYTARCVHQWILECYPDHRYRDPKDYIFPGRSYNGGLTGRAVYKIFSQLAAKAGLPKEARHPHILKRTRCQHILEEAVRQGLPADTVYQSLALIVGHQTAMTTLKHYTTQTGQEKELVTNLTKRLVEGGNLLDV